MTEISIQQLCAQIEAFQQELSARHWIAESAVRTVDKSSAADLFAEYDNRPLVVGLFGGTGAGKSSLLNRLAGADIARTGVVRPTSMEITAYLHNDKQVSALPSGFPQHNFAQVSHQSDRFKEVMWVDMPDFDSEETQNRDQVLQWLPYIDLVIYVVTPERYRDAEGWRLIQSQGYRHGWLFVMNQWDKAEAVQLQDFRELLQKTGFAQPKIFKTSCAVDDLPDDEFDQLTTLVASLAEHNIVQQLEQYGWLQRLDSAGAQLHAHKPMFDVPETDLLVYFDQQWQEVKAEIEATALLPVRDYSQRFSNVHRSPLKNALRAVGSQEQDEGQNLDTLSIVGEASSLWGDWSATRLKDSINHFELAETVHGVPAIRLKAARPAQSLEQSFAHIGSSWERQVTEAVANPGPPWRRHLYTVCRWLSWILPIAVAGWIAVRVVEGFAAGAADRTAYVGVDFLVNGLLLAALAWIIPQVLAAVARPSVPASVQRALSAALESDLDEFGAVYRKQLSQVADERGTLVQQCAELLQQADQMRQRYQLSDNAELEGLVLRR